MGSVNNLEIVKLRAGDEDAVAADDIARATLSPSTRTNVVTELTTDVAHVWVARSAGQVCGLIAGWHIADEFHIHNVATDPGHRRAGVGRALVEAVLAWSRQQAIRLALLEVKSRNQPAIALYRRAGFEVTARRKNYYEDDGDDALEMMLVLGALPGQTHPRQPEP